MIVLRKSSGDDAVTPLRTRGDVVGKVKRSLRRRRIERDFARYASTRPAGFELFSDDRTEHGDQLLKQIPECDVINLHWVAGLVDHEHFFRGVRSNVPLVWRLADMSPLTGGCHYDHGCGKFADRCGACPQLGSRDEQDLSREIWARKNASLARHRPGGIHLVATSDWIAGEAKRSSLLRECPVTVIPNALDVDDFAPRDKGFARDLWNIPRDATVILFVGETLELRRKGFAELTAALSGLTNVPRPFLLSVGGMKSKLELPIPHLNLGKINNDRLLSLAYSTADVFVMPSLQESFGQTVIESMACGTPVVAFATGGVPDMVRPEQTGWLAPTGDTAALRDAIVAALSDPAARAMMSQTCRDTAVREYALDVQARRYEGLYQTLLASAARRSPATADPASPYEKPSPGIAR
jgi:glycosyltransferase involved in cell wall biosynthesis